MNTQTTQETIDRSRSSVTPSDERVSREIDTRKRDVQDEDFDFANFDYNAFDPRRFNLDAPAPRIDEKWGKMRQRWVAFKVNNGQLYRKAKDMGYRIRNPETIPLSFRGNTEQWEAREAVIVAGDMILMEIPEFHWIKLQKIKHERNNGIIKDIKNSHGKITRIDNGEVQEFKENNVSKFYTTTSNVREMSGDDISFDD